MGSGFDPLDQGLTSAYRVHKDSPRDVEVESLGLGSVLVDALPATLLTEKAPDRYVVAAVFTRRPEDDEIAGILAEETHAVLAKAGYPNVQLRVSDRRLEIANTSLEQLRDGLAVVVADVLADVSAKILTRHEDAAARLRAAAVREQERAAAVAALAGAVTFKGRGGVAGAVGGDAELGDWDDDGGRGR